MGFDASDVAHELVVSLRGFTEKLRALDAYLWDQLNRAKKSVPLNVDEGRRRQGRDRLHHWRIAAGSAAEVQSVLRLCVSLGYVTVDELSPSLALLDRELAMLWRMTHGSGRT